MEAFLVECVQHSLNSYLHSNAIWLCERLYATSASEANAFLLATCYFRNGQEYRAYHILKGSTSHQSRYLLALCCHKLGKLSEAEEALTPEASSTDTEVPGGAAGCYLLGIVCKESDRRTGAVKHLKRALLLDPFMWCAYKELCLLGADEEAANILQAPDLEDFLNANHMPAEPTAMPGTAPGAALPLTPVVMGAATPHMATVAPSTGLTMTPVPQTGASAPPPSPRVRQGPPGPATRSARGPGSSAVTPQTGAVGMPIATPSETLGSPRGSSSPGVFVTPSPSGSVSITGASGGPPHMMGKHALGPPSARPATAGPPSSSATPTPCAAGVSTRKRREAAVEKEEKGTRQKVSSRLSFSDSAQLPSALRRSTRLSSSHPPPASHAPDSSRPPSSRRAGPAAGMGSPPQQAAMGGPGAGSPSRTPAGPEFALEPPSDPGPGAASPSGASQALQLLRILARGFRLLCKYECREALQTLQQLPPHHYATGWVLCTVGRAHYEVSEYAEAARAFDWARRVDPTRIEGLEILSTVLWHLKREVELSFLAQEVVALDRLAPETWCVMGNCFSLQKEHDTALRFFQRALQVDPKCAYAHTLCGHEYFMNEDFEKGLVCYRNAIRIDARHYNAWYGVGQVYMRQEKYQLAEYHFRRALQINSRSSVLHCFLGMTQHSLQDHQQALDNLERAIELNANNPLARYEKATVLASKERYEEALEELQTLKDSAPREASVYYLMGKMYKKLDRPQQAMIQYFIALDLKPSSSDTAQIKSAIEKLTIPNACEEDDL